MKIVADSFIPFLAGRLEPFAQVEYIHPDTFTPRTISGADALLIRTRTRCGAPLLEGSTVKMVATGTIGMDQFDLPWCEANGVAAYNSPGCNAPGVAQYVWSSLLHVGINPRGLKIGVVGHGHVGSIVAEWGRHLGAEVLLCDPPRHEELVRVGEKSPYIPLAQLLAVSDVVTLHTPLTRTGAHPTYHTIGEREVAQMRQGAILINAARGPVVDSHAVAESAVRGRIRLITDTWEGEPGNLNANILKESFIATPHIAGYSLQGKQRATRMICEAIGRHFSLPIAAHKGEEGIKVWDLPEPYHPLATISALSIAESYDPIVDTIRLRTNPREFEQMRDHYQYRSEPKEVLGNI